MPYIPPDSDLLISSIRRKKPMVLISGIIGTILSVWLYYNFCNWLNVLNWGISSINGMVVAVVCYLIGYFVKEKSEIK